MGPLAAVERFLERLFERQTARLFKTAIRPIQVQRRLERAMEGSRVRDGSRTLVPHRLTVRLTPDDLAALRALAPSLAADLADGALAFARAHGYSLLDRPTVSLRADPSVEVGDIVVDVIAPGQPEGVREFSSAPASPEVAPPSPMAPPGPIAPPSSRPGAPTVAPRLTAGPGPADGTAVFVVPISDGPRATLREYRPDGSSRTIVFDGRPLTIGRAPDNGLVVRDGRASRHHARIDGRRGSLVLSDLGSSNGSFVNDRRVESVALGAGDRIRIGTTSFVVEALGEQVASDDAPGEPAPAPRVDAPDDSGR
jgi:predicted component of type VI protein secretion system